MEFDGIFFLSNTALILPMVNAFPDYQQQGAQSQNCKKHTVQSFVDMRCF